MEYSEEHLEADRDFLHDLATPIAIIKQSIKRLLSAAEASEPLDQEKLKLHMTRALEAINQVESLHATQKERIYLRSK